MDLTAYVPKDLADLLPGFLPNRRTEVRLLRRALVRADWPNLQELAERMYALGNPYGFRQITTYGRLMREACADRDLAALRRLIDEYATYLARVTVIEVEAPVVRHVLSAASRRTLLAHRPSKPAQV